MLATHISAMEPLLPADRDGGLRALAETLLRESAALGGALHPVTRHALAGHLAGMNSYYSNLIEDHATHPLDIERALRGDYARDPAQRALQEESRAHVEVERLLVARLADEPDLSVFGEGLLRWLHREFHARLPDSVRAVQGANGTELVEPGLLRARDVVVGAHVAPESACVPAFLARLEQAYSPSLRHPASAVIAAAAAHHRFMWVHPFLDGNGRVIRLATEAWLERAGAGAGGLWRLSRGLAWRRPDYLRALAEADQPRRGDLDGRGARSLTALDAFVRFILETALDQVRFIGGLLDFDEIERRVRAWVEWRAALRELKVEAFPLLRDAFFRGQIPRGEAARITGLPERSARLIVAQLVKERVLVSETSKAALRLGFPVRVMGAWFPALYPEGVVGVR